MNQKERINLINQLNTMGSDEVHHFTIENVLYKILILGRGDMLFYSENNKSLICEISARNCLLSLNSLKYWGGNKKIEDKEKDHLFERIKKVYTLAYKNELQKI